jgi:transcriptional regulator with AAA-type ATPase domain
MSMAGSSSLAPDWLPRGASGTGGSVVDENLRSNGRDLAELDRREHRDANAAMARRRDRYRRVAMDRPALVEVVRVVDVKALGGPRAGVRGLSPEAASAFMRYEWPGNVRELRNAIERALILEDGDLITTKYLPSGLVRDPACAAAAVGAGGDLTPAASAVGVSHMTLPPGGISLDEVEISLVRQAIARSSGNQTRAAELLGISRNQLRYRLKILEEQGGQEG